MPGVVEPSAGRALLPADRVLLQGTLVVRYAGLALTFLAVGYDRDTVQRPATAVIVVTVITAVTVTATVLFQRRPALLLHPLVVGAELITAGGVQLADGWVFGPNHATHAAALAGLWVLAAIITAGVAWGPAAGAIAGLAVAAGRLLGGLAPDLDQSVLDKVLEPPGGALLLPTASTIALFALVGAGAAYLSRLLNDAENDIAELHARQRLGATLHDGVLQSLAYITRRAADPDIARVARDADIELRAFLRAPTTSNDSDLAAAIIAAARRAGHQLGCPLRIAVDDELPHRPPEVIAAVTGAVTEAVTNAAKHADADQVTLYAAATADGGIDISVTDDGVGFDPQQVPAGGGLDQSLRARLRVIDGTTTVTSTPGAGTEIQLWIP